jgi:hypothetical protein
MSGAAGDGARRANAADEDVPQGEDFEGEYNDEEEDEDGYEFGDAEEAMQCVEMAERSTDAGAHDYEALAARKRKAFAEEQPQRYQIFLTLLIRLREQALVDSRLASSIALSIQRSDFSLNTPAVK